MNQNSYGSGWEIGAHVFAGFATYGGGGPSSTYFSIGEGLTSFLCGPPNYVCALNSTETEGQAVIQNITPTPNMGNLTGAGTVVTPADFNLPICRLTDATFDPSVPNNTIVANSGGSGDETLFNTNSTLLVVGRGGEGYPMSLSFNGATCTPGRLYASNPSWSARGGWYLPSDDPGWSYTNPYLLFLFDATNPAIDSYNVSGYSPTGTPPANVQVYDFRAGQTGSWGTTGNNCLASDYAMTWASFGKQNKATGLLAADQVFAAGVSNAIVIAGAVSSGTFSNGETVTQSGTGATATLHFVHTNLYVDTVTGSPNNSGTWVGGASGAVFTPTALPTAAGQNFGTDAVAYKVGSGCSYLNTLTGTVTGDFGTTGPVGIGDRFTVHNAKISKDGNWLLLSFEFCLSTCTNNVNTSYIWQIGTTNLYAGCVSPNDCGGHFTEGYSHFVNDDGSPTLQQISRLYGSNSTGSIISMGLPWTGSSCTGVNVVDTHQNWTNVDLLDTYPVFQTTFLATPSTAANPYVCAGADEVQGINPTTGTVYRFAHTYNSDQNVNFSTAETIGAVSQDGNYAMWSSDWEGTLGSTSGGSTCALTTTCRGDVFVVALDGGPTLGDSPMFGFSETGTGSGNFPTVSYGMQRLWDSPPLQWPSIETAANTFTFTNLDTMLAQDYSNAVTEAMYTLARTPPWITSQPTDTTCNYQSPAVGGGNGECFAPSDLNADGSGTNATWKAWITKIAQHANGQDGNAGYLASHAHIRYWEIWNEPDAAAYWSGSFAQLARLTEDANCIITGRGVIHPNGNGTAVACTATAIDPTARIVMSSGHATSAAVLTYAQNQLYCNNTAGIPSYELPCPNPANAIAAAVDILNYHMKPGNTTGNNCPAPTACTPETAMAAYMSSIRGTLQAAELAKPIWDGEMSYSIAGFTTPYSDPDMAASFLPRMYLMMWSLGISGSAFYSWDSLKAEPAEVQTAYQQTYGWLAGAMLTSPCSSSGTVYRCGIVKNGVPYSIIWDSSQSCSGGSCTTGNQTVPPQWGHSQDMTTGSTPAAVTGSTVAVGVKPVVLSR